MAPREPSKLPNPIYAFRSGIRMIAQLATFHRSAATGSLCGVAILRGSVLALLILAAGGCDGSSPTVPVPSEQDPPIPLGSPLPAHLADVTTTLDFGDPPFSGRLRITPSQETSELHYAIDLNGDALTDEMGPLGLGVALTYLYETTGAHEIGIAIRAGTEWFRDDRVVIVNDPEAIRVADSVWYPEGLAGDFSGIALDEARNIIYVATGGLDRRDILAFRSTNLGFLWRLSLSATEPGDATALALSTDGSVLYVDTGDSIEAVSVIGARSSLGVVGPGDVGTSLVLGDDGILFSGGSNGIARIDPASGQVLARRDALFGGGGGFSLSMDEDRVAFLESTHLCRLSLLDAQDLESLWTVEDLATGSEDCIRVAFSPRDDALYVLAGSDGWLLLVVDVATGSVMRRIKLAEEDRRTRSPGASSGSATVADGRYVAFSTERGAFLVDTATQLPAYALSAITDDRAIGCCNIMAGSGGFYTAGWNLVMRLSLAP